MYIIGFGLGIVLYLVYIWFKSKRKEKKCADSVFRNHRDAQIGRLYDGDGIPIILMIPQIVRLYDGDGIKICMIISWKIHYDSRYEIS